MVEELLPVLAAFGIKDVEVRRAAPRLGDVMRNYSDTSKAARMLGWRAEVDLKEGLRRTVDWFVGQSRGR
jgi:UDP-glucose 4-epimerase